MGEPTSVVAGILCTQQPMDIDPSSQSPEVVCAEPPQQPRVTRVTGVSPVVMDQWLQSVQQQLTLSEAEVEKLQQEASKLRQQLSDRLSHYDQESVEMVSEQAASLPEVQRQQQMVTENCQRLLSQLREGAEIPYENLKSQLIQMITYSQLMTCLYTQCCSLKLL